MCGSCISKVVCWQQHHSKWRLRGNCCQLQTESLWKHHGAMAALQQPFLEKSPQSLLAKNNKHWGHRSWVLEENPPGSSLFLKTASGYQQLTGRSCNSKDEVVYMQRKHCNGIALLWQQGDRNLGRAFLDERCCGAVVVLWQHFWGDGFHLVVAKSNKWQATINWQQPQNWGGLMATLFGSADWKWLQ